MSLYWCYICLITAQQVNLMHFWVHVLRDHRRAFVPMKFFNASFFKLCRPVDVVCSGYKRSSVFFCTSQKINLIETKTDYGIIHASW